MRGIDEVVAAVFAVAAGDADAVDADVMFLLLLPSERGVARMIVGCPVGCLLGWGTKNLSPKKKELIGNLGKRGAILAIRMVRKRARMIILNRGRHPRSDPGLVTTRRAPAPQQAQRQVRSTAYGGALLHLAHRGAAFWRAVK